jgi:HEAT repeat protein
MDLTAIPTTEMLARAAEAAQGAGRLDAQSVWPLIYELQDRCEREVFDAAVAWCASPVAPIRELGASVLGELGLDEYLPFARESHAPLLALIDDPDSTVIATALWALDSLEGGDTEAICRRAAHPDREVRIAVARCLGDHCGETAVRTLLALIIDPEPEVRCLATSALGSLRDEDTEEIRRALVARLSDEHGVTREEAIYALAIRGDARVDFALASALSDPNAGELIRMAALHGRGRQN